MGVTTTTVKRHGQQVATDTRICSAKHTVSAKTIITLAVDLVKLVAVSPSDRELLG